MIPQWHVLGSSSVSAKIDLGLYIILPFKEQLKIWRVEAEEWAGAASRGREDCSAAAERWS